MSVENFGLRQIGQIHIAVQDLDRAVRFYRDVLGMNLLFQFPGMAFFDCGGIRLYLSRAEGPEVTGTSILYYRVSPMSEAAAVLETRGVRFVEPPHVVHRDAAHELWMGFFKDPEGNLLALMSEVPKA